MKEFATVEIGKPFYYKDRKWYRGIKKSGMNAYRIQWRDSLGRKVFQHSGKSEDKRRAMKPLIQQLQDKLNDVIDTYRQMIGIEYII